MALAANFRGKAVGTRPPEDQSQGFRHDRTENTGNCSQLPVTPCFASKRRWRSASSLRTQCQFSCFCPTCPLRTFIPYAAMSETSSNRWNLPPFGFTGHRSLATILSHHATTSYRQRLFVEHDRGESSGSAALAARRVGYPWTEQMDRKLSRNV